jgi:hypothetical protein
MPDSNPLISYPPRPFNSISLSLKLSTGRVCGGKYQPLRVFVSHCTPLAFAPLTTLLIPSCCPAAGAKGSVSQHELHAISMNGYAWEGCRLAHLAAGSKVLALGDDALVVVDIVLPAVLGLVLVGEAGVEACVVISTSASHIKTL